MKQRNLALILALLTLFIIPYAEASVIRGFHQLRYSNNLSINSTSLNIFTGNASRIFITDTGLVGIGTADPTAILDVAQGATTSTNIDHNDTAFTDGLAWNMTLLNVTSVAGFPKSGTLVIDYEAISYTGIDTALNTFTGLTRGMLGTTANNHTNNSVVYFMTSSVTRNTTLTPFSVVRSDGNVGIGTVSPNQKLVVVGDINVTGTSYLGEVTVNADNITINRVTTKDGNISFFNGSAEEIMRLTGAGRLGVGVMNATAFLDLAASTTTTASLRVQTGSAPSSPEPGDIYSTGTILYFYDGSTWLELTPSSSAGGWTDDGDVVRLTGVSNYVGIGTTTPSEKLTVTGNASISSDLIVGGNLIGPYGAGAAQVASFGWTDGGAVVYLDTSTDLVGIGTTAPATTLHINGSGSNAGFMVTNQTGDFSFFVNASLGRVGIGTLKPSQALEVNGSINVTGTSANSTFSGDVRILGTLYGGSPLKVGGGLNVTSGNISFPDGTMQYSSTGPGSDVNFTTLNVSGQALFASGNVGIGLSTPSHTLTVAGDLNVTGASYLGDIVISADNMSVNEIVSRNENISFFNYSKDEKLRILHDGRVGINDSTPSYGLDITGTLRSTNDAYFATSTGNVGIGTTSPSTAGTTPVLEISGTSPSIAWEDTTAGASGHMEIYMGNDDLRVANATTEHVFVTFEDSGNVGIGTTTPNYKLEVSDTSANGKSANISNVLYVNESSGRVGIGTTSPGAELEVNDATPRIRLETGDGTTAGVFGIESSGNEGILDLMAGVTTYDDGAGAQIRLQSASTNQGTMEFQVYSGSAMATALYIDKDANVGIGTASPSAPLEIEGSEDGDWDALRLYNDIQSDGDNSATIQILPFWGDLSTADTHRDAGYIEFGKEADYETAGNSDSYMAFATTLDGSNSEQMRIDSSGNVGIGTTSPTDLLELAKSNDDVQLLLSTYDDGAVYSLLRLDKSDSDTIGTMAETDDEDNFGAIEFRGVDGANNRDYGAVIRAVQEGASSTRAPTKMHLYTFSATGSNQPHLVLDAAGNVGISTTAPDGIFDIQADSAIIYMQPEDVTVEGSTKDSATLRLRGKYDLTTGGAVVNADYDADIIHVIDSTTPASHLAFKVGGSERLQITQTGNILMPALQTTGEDVAACFIAATGELIEDGATTCASSSKRYKENIKPLEYGLKEVLQLKPSSFTLKSNGRRGMGLIAEDVEPIIPELIYYDEQGRVDTLHFYDLHGLTFKAIQEQQQMIDDLKKNNQNQQSQIEQLKARIKELESKS